MLVLASASPRRHALLTAAGFAFVVEPADVDESIDSSTEPGEAARELAERKSRAVVERMRGDVAWVLGADTVVAVPDGDGWELIGKPEDATEAARFLGRLSGTRHQVVTGVSIAEAATGRVATRSERTWVTMREITADEVSAYVATGEWRGKAGGYAIQENADRFVTGLDEGGFDNVVGLPVALVRKLLAETGFPGARG